MICHLLLRLLSLIALKCVSIDGFTMSRLHSVRRDLKVSMCTSKDDDLPISESAQVVVNPRYLYPVISRIANTEWTGRCKYTGADLSPLNIKLVGGVRYDIVAPGADDDNQQHFVRLSSFLTFPNGKTREVVMQGRKDGTHPLKLVSIEDDGPIYMLLTELAPDTILINEIEKSSGRTIMTASLSIVEKDNGEMELIQISHEVGDNDVSLIEGHQTWRLYKNRAIEFDDFGVQDTTRR